jgi:uncharacterized protein (TIGR00730 family)
VFCGSATPPDPRYAGAARALGRLLADQGIGLVYGGGSVGLMGEIADAALASGGRVVGVIPAGLFEREVTHRGLTELHEVASMHARKQLMYDLSDGFVALPGGLGTLEELAEVTTWSQLGLHAKPVVLLDVDGFWDPLGAQLDRMVGVGLLKPAGRELIQRAGSPKEALATLAAARPRQAERWIGPGQR